MTPDTPRTDAMTASHIKVGGFGMTVHSGAVYADFARTLERELTEVKVHFKQADEERHQQSSIIEELAQERAQLRATIRIACETLDSIHITAHCIAKAGPLNTPTLQDAWVKFMDLEGMAVKGLSAIREAKS